MSGIVRSNNAGQSGIASNIETINSDDYVDGSIDTAHIGNDQVTGAKLNPSLVLGDIIYATGTDAIGRLAKGCCGEVLTMGGSNAPTWAAASGGGLDSCADAIINNGYGIVIGHCAVLGAADHPANTVGEFTMIGAAGGDTGVHIIRHAADAGGGAIRFAKSRNATVGSHTVVQACDTLGEIAFFGDDGGDLEPFAATIKVFVDGTPGTGDMPGRMEFSTTADGAETSTLAMTIESCGDVQFGGACTNNILYINDTTSGSVTCGGIVMHNVCDIGQILCFKSGTNVGLTNLPFSIPDVEADTFGAIGKLGGNGGLTIFGGTTGTGTETAIVIEAWVRATNEAKTAAAYGAIDIMVGSHDGSNGSTCFTANANLLSVSADNAGTRTNKFIVDVEGDVHYDGGTNASAWDDYCDVALLTSMRAIVHPEGSHFKKRFSSFIDEYACVLEQTGVVHLNRDTDSVPFVSTKGLNGLMIDSIRQLHGKVVTMENQLKALQGGCP